MMEQETPSFPETSLPAAGHASRRFVLTGSRLPINKVHLVESLLKAGASITKTAKDIGISRNSVKGIADRLKASSVKGHAAHCGALPEQPFESYVKGDLQRVARLALSSVTPEKAEGATLRDLAFTTDKMLNRLEVIEARQNNLQAFTQLFGQYGIETSHSVSRLTLEQKVTVETQHKSETTT